MKKKKKESEGRSKTKEKKSKTKGGKITQHCNSRCTAFESRCGTRSLSGCGGFGLVWYGLVGCVPILYVKVEAKAKKTPPPQKGQRPIRGSQWRIPHHAHLLAKFRGVGCYLALISTPLPSSSPPFSFWVRSKKGGALGRRKEEDSPPWRISTCGSCPSSSSLPFSSSLFTRSIALLLLIAEFDFNLLDSVS